MKSWTERLMAPARAEVKPAPVSIAGMKAGEIILAPIPRMIDDFIRAIPRGDAVGVKEMRRRLAPVQGARVTCPIYTGYHLRTAAEAAHREPQGGASLGSITPFWRVIDARTPTTKRLSFGAAVVAERRLEEGLPA